MFSPYPKEAKQLLNGCWLVPPSKCRRNNNSLQKIFIQRLLNFLSIFFLPSGLRAIFSRLKILQFEPQKLTSWPQKPGKSVQTTRKSGQIWLSYYFCYPLTQKGLLFHSFLKQLENLSCYTLKEFFTKLALVQDLFVFIVKERRLQIWSRTLPTHHLTLSVPLFMILFPAEQTWAALNELALKVAVVGKDVQLGVQLSPRPPGFGLSENLKIKFFFLCKITSIAEDLNSLSKASLILTYFKDDLKIFDNIVLPHVKRERQGERERERDLMMTIRKIWL